MPNQTHAIPTLPVQPRYRTAFYGAIIIAVTMIAFLPSLHAGFTNWDDEEAVVKNPDITAFNPKNIKKVFSSTCLSNYQPLTMLTYMAEYRFFGLNPAAFHATNLFLHVANCLVLFAFLLSLTGNRSMALVATLLFAIHPLRVESVAWISERKDVLSSFFYLLSLLLYVSYRKKGGVTYYLLCLFSLVMSLLSKPMAVSQPFVLLLIDYLGNKRLDLRKTFEKLPFLAVAAAFAAIAFYVQQGSGAIHAYPSIMMLQRLCVPFYGLVFYLVKFILPVHLSAVYPFPINYDSSIAFALYVSPLIIIGIVFAIIRYQGTLKKTLAFASLFYLITLLPVLQIIPIGVSIVADRYTYIPMIGIALLCSAAGMPSGLLAQQKSGKSRSRVQDESTHRKTIPKAAQTGSAEARSKEAAYRQDRNIVPTGDRNRGRSILCIVVPAILFFILGYLTFQRCRVWRDNFTLWNDAINRFPASAIQGYANRGRAYIDTRQYDLAISDFTKAIYLKPDYTNAYVNRGATYHIKGLDDSAIADFSRAINLDRGCIAAYNTRGAAYDNLGKHELAIADFTRVLSLDPRHPLTNNARGIAYGSIGRYDLAIMDFTQAIKLDPGNLNAYTNRGILYAAIGACDNAIADLSTVIALDPNYAEGAYANRGIAYMGKKLFQPAARDLEMALSLNPNDPVALRAYSQATAFLKRNPTHP